MVSEILEKKPISIPEVKEILDKVVSQEEAIEVPEEEMDTTLLMGTEMREKYYLRATHEYVKLFSKVDARIARNVVNMLIKEGIPENIAIQIININPDSVEELSLFFERGGKRLSKEEIEALLFKIREAKN